MTAQVADARPPVRERARLRLAGLGVLLLVVALVPPLSTEARRFEYVEAIQFALLALAVPALVVLGAPWRFLRLAGRSPGAGAAGVPTRPLDRLQAGRRRHPEFTRSLGFLALDLAAVVGWRVPATVDALARDSWMVSVEAASLVLCGLGLWLECVASPPLTSRLTPPKRAALAAFAMWTVWVAAYLLGLSHASWYQAYPHMPGRGVSVWADQEITTGVLWLASVCAFIPVIFWNLVAWLGTEDDPDHELYRLVREGRRRTWGAADGSAEHQQKPSG